MAQEKYSTPDFTQNETTDLQAIDSASDSFNGIYLNQIIFTSASVEIFIGWPSDENPDMDSLSSCLPQQRRKWRKKAEPTSSTAFQPHRPVVNDINSIMDSFFMFFNDDIIEHILYQSNLKSVQKSKPASITKEKIYVFFGINILMSYHWLPGIRY